MFLIPAYDRRQASPMLRDKFLNALDQQDQPSLREAVRDLVGCLNYLPSSTCTLLGLAPGSTYGDAAAAISKTPPAPISKTPPAAISKSPPGPPGSGGQSS